MTRNETAEVGVDLTNTTDKTIYPVFEGEISSTGFLVRDVRFNPTILPGETSHIGIQVDSQDLFYNLFILVRTYQFPTYKTPSRMGSCAILMVPITFLSGDQVLYLTLAMIGLCLFLGIFLWVKGNRPLQGVARTAFSAMLTMSFLVLAAITVGIIGNWMFGVILLAVMVLLLVVAIGYFGNSPH
jgi:hypothetical protein